MPYYDIITRVEKRKQEKINLIQILLLAAAVKAAIAVGVALVTAVIAAGV